MAVKTLKENASEKEKTDLIQELTVMKNLGTHPNVVRLIGCCTEKVYLLLWGTYYFKINFSRTQIQEDSFLNVKPTDKSMSKLTYHLLDPDHCLHIADAYHGRV